MEHEETKGRRFIGEEEYNKLLSLSNTIIGAAIEVHKELGPGLLESVYEDCLKVELEMKGLNVKTQIDLPFWSWLTLKWDCWLISMFQNLSMELKESLMVILKKMIL